MKTGAGDDPFADDVVDDQDDLEKVLDEADHDVDDVVAAIEAEEEGEEDPRDFVDEIVDVLEEVESGETKKTIAFRDGRMKALLTALDESDGDEMIELGQRFQEVLGRDRDEEFDRSDIVRLAMRVALQEAAPETMDQLAQALGRHAQQSV